MHDAGGTGPTGSQGLQGPTGGCSSCSPHAVCVAACEHALWRVTQLLRLTRLLLLRRRGHGSTGYSRRHRCLLNCAGVLFSCHNPHISMSRNLGVQSIIYVFSMSGLFCFAMHDVPSCCSPAGGTGTTGLPGATGNLQSALALPMSIIALLGNQGNNCTHEPRISPTSKLHFGSLLDQALPELWAQLVLPVMLPTFRAVIVGQPGDANAHHRFLTQACYQADSSYACSCILL